MLPETLDRILPHVQKPARYTGGELNSVAKDKERVNIRFAFCFPDLYEVGMSHLGMKILYSLQNAREDVWCERVFAPAPDMEELMRLNHILLYGLESFDPIRDFDIIGFTLQYELSYTAVLNMLDLAGLPVLAVQRDESAPLVVAGGPCACNPEPMSDFIDLFLLGEGEELNLDLIDLVKEGKAAGWSKKELLKRAAGIPGVYVPSLYRVEYLENGSVERVVPLDGAPLPVQKRIIRELDRVYFPDRFVVPYTEPVHDRAMVEVLRGCLRGCRFCQAGFIYRPFREKEPGTVNRDGKALCDSTGYDEISLTSLSTSDYSRLEELLEEMLEWSGREKVNLSLPSLRADNFSDKLLQKIAKVRKSGLTFAPEAGTQRLRDVINKNITEEDLMEACRTAFAGGYTSVKLYFMMGLPTETEEDVRGIAELAQRVVDLYYSLPDKPRGKGVQVTISVACFVPKPFTPFQFEPQNTLGQFQEKVGILKDAVRSRKITVKYHEPGVSVLEAVLARGDRRMGRAVLLAWEKGGKLDGWDEWLDLSRWREAIKEADLDAEFYANRSREYEEILPWDHLDYGVSKGYLIRENRLAREARTTPHCRERCSGCGVHKLAGGRCVN